ncbi:uncharacterized protein LOC116024949 [Ipomoea triloba]|uniref:uncharacterized protein LOC116024949 n=1 Tax=Ipomoea triloba TaxID=35885 RepID=UPI00125D16D8|nr:uncharacterized protein LOC116024949 [Ipomoea triloba]
MEAMSFKKRVRDDSDELAFNSPEVKRLRENLLDDLDDSEFSAATQDLYSFMKSFEDEITASPLPAAESVSVDDLTAGTRPDLGFLLEASDHELGLPPPTASPSRVENELTTQLVGVPSESIEFGVGGGSWGLEEQIPSCDSFELGILDLENFDFSGGEYVALDGLFDHSDLGFGSTDFLR